MLVCKNCGHNNPVNSMKCSNCTVMLEGSMVDKLVGGRKDSLSNSLTKCPNCGIHNTSGTTICTNCKYPLAPKIAEMPVVQPVNPSPVIKKESEGAKFCPGCGYPNIPSAEKCKQCDRMFRIEENQVKKTPITPAATAIKIPKEGLLNKTINPYLEENVELEKVNFKLIPVAKELEAPIAEMNYLEKRVVLNRKNTEPLNMTITSGEQAVIELKNGVWHIENKSKQETTFIKVKNSVPLKKGDVILLGNRLFIFDTQD